MSVNKISLDGSTTHLIEPTLFAVAGGTASAYTATISNFELVEGVVVNVKFTTTNSANATLNIAATGTKSIYYNNQSIEGNILKTDHIYSLLYDGIQWQIIGDIDTDSRIEIINFS